MSVHPRLILEIPTIASLLNIAVPIYHPNVSYYNNMNQLDSGYAL